jgi:hypothetical protein
MGFPRNKIDANAAAAAGLDCQLAAAFSRLSARPVPIAMLDLVAVLDHTYPARRRERALDDA